LTPTTTHPPSHPPTTITPTILPTQMTFSPTLSPSESPSQSPTPEPSHLPSTHSPTIHPTLHPVSHLPTHSPSAFNVSDIIQTSSQEDQGTAAETSIIVPITIIFLVGILVLVAYNRRQHIGRYLGYTYILRKRDY